MALTGSTVATLGDIAKRLDKDGKIDKIVELLGIDPFAQTHTSSSESEAQMCSDSSLS